MTPHDRARRPPADLDLIEAARARDPQAIEDLYRRHRDAALRLARGLTDPVTADDVVAEAFLQVFETIRSGRGPTVAFRPYLLTTVRNSYVNHLRRNRGLVWVEDHATPDLEPVEDEALPLAQESRLLADAFAALPERWQLVLWHSTVEGDDHRTIARLLGIKANAVAALAFRAREGLRKAYLSAHLAGTDDPVCREVRGHLPDVVRGRRRGRRHHELEDHLSGCAGCRAALLELQALNSDLGALLAPVVLGVAGAEYGGLVGPGVAAVPGRAAEPGPRRGRGDRHLIRTPSTVAASVAAVAAVAVAVGATVLVAGRILDHERGTQSAAGSASPGPATTAATRPPSEEPSRPGQASRSPVPERTPTFPVTSPADGSTGTAGSPLADTEPTEPTEPTDPSTSPAVTLLTAVLPQEPDTGSASPTDPPPSVSPTTPPASPPTPSGQPTPVRTTADLSLRAPAHVDYGTHDHLQMEVSTPIEPTTLLLEVTGLVSHAVHQDLDFVGTACVSDPSTPAPGDVTRLVCTLAAGTGTFAVDLVVQGALHVTVTISARDNDDPDPSNDIVTFG